jgi:hypothetical protein
MSVRQAYQIRLALEPYKLHCLFRNEIIGPEPGNDKLGKTESEVGADLDTA